MTLLVVGLLASAFIVDRVFRSPPARPLPTTREYHEEGTSGRVAVAADACEAAQVLSRGDTVLFLVVKSTGERVTMRRTEKGWQVSDPVGDFARAAGIDLRATR